jgi:hypothetical protein
MKRMIVAALFALCVGAAYGQEYLDPYEIDPSNAERWNDLFSRLYEGFSEKPAARFTCLPFMHLERAFAIEKRGGRRFVVSNTFANGMSYWWSTPIEFVDWAEFEGEGTTNYQPVKKVKPKKFRLCSSRREITPELYAAIHEMFQTLAAGIRVWEPDPDPERITVMDGERLIFATTNAAGVVISGETYAPHDTVLEDVYRVCDRLYDFGARKIGNTHFYAWHKSRREKRQNINEMRRHSIFSQEEMAEEIRALTARLD